MSSIVIKVKYGETLRRLNVPIKDNKLVLDMIVLKEKIRSLFSFGSDVEFTMTYVDEDGDTVTLADDDDLHDVVRQSLNPLRIIVSLNDSNFNASSGNSTPLRSQHNNLPFETLNSGASEVSKSVPEPLLEAFAKLSLDLASKASSSAPVVGELVEKMKAVYSSQVTASPGVHPDGPLNVNSESPIVVNPETGSLNMKKKEKQVQKATEGVKLNDVQPPRGVDLNVPYSDYESFQAPISSSTKNVGVDKKKDSSSEKEQDRLAAPWRVEQINQFRKHIRDRMASQFDWASADINNKTNDSGSSSGWAQGMLNATNQCPFSGIALTSDTDSQGRHCRSRSPHWKRYNLDNNGTGTIFHRGVRCDGCGVHPITGPRFKSKVKYDYDLCNVCFAGTGNATDYIRIDRPINGFRHHSAPFRGFYDPCLRVPPAMPPHAMRDPVLSKLDSRFILDVNVLDGTIMAPLTTFTKIWKMKNNGTVIWPYGSQLLWIGGDRLNSSDSVDVEIPVDGLPVGKELDIAVDFTAPELPGRYVSYWRMASPSGQKFGQRVWVLIQVDASLKNSGETPINLNLPHVTNDPEAVNQDHLADNIFSNSIITDSHNTSVDLPHKDHEMSFPTNDPLIIDNGGSLAFNSTEVGTALGSLPAGPTDTSRFYPTIGFDTEPISYPTVVDFPVMAITSGGAPPTVVDPPSGAGGSLVFNSTEVATALGSLPAGHTDASLFRPTVGFDTEPISHPTVVDFPVMPPITSGGAASPPMVVDPPSGSGGVVISDDVEQALVKDLEEMGFKQKDLNKEILRMNNYDMQKSVDDLCGVLEWDPMLDELQEMGFADVETNRKLLKKNNGSIKRVVMDLINGEKA